MRISLFGIGTQSESRAITAERRINCIVEPRKEMDRTAFALISRPGLSPFLTSLGASPSRGMWAVNTLATPLMFTTHAGTEYSVNNAAVFSAIGTLGTTSGDVSKADDGTFLVLADGVNGYVYNMSVPAGVNAITSGTFAPPKTISWQDNYFISTANNSRQFQLSQITPSVDPTVWPSNQIGFAGSGAGSLQAGLTANTILNLFGPDYAEFWQDTGSPDLPYAKIPGNAPEFGLAAPFSLAKFDNSFIGLFKNRQGGINVSRMAGYSLKKVSDQDMDQIFTAYTAVSDAEGFSFMIGGHPMYLIRFPSENQTWVYDGLSDTWAEWEDTNGDMFWGNKFALFVNRPLVSDYRNGNIYQMSPGVYDDNGSQFGMEVVSKHIWEDDKYLSISDLQIDVESGAGLVSGQGSNPVMDLQVSKDGGNSFYSVGFSSIGKIGEYTQRVKWRSLGAARDWILKLRITDPIKRVITGASAEITGGSF